MVIWTQTARCDLKNIFEFVSKDSVFYAKKVISEIFEKAENISEFPSVGRVVPEIEQESIREIFLYSYRMIYEISGRDIFILTLAHMKRDLSSFNPK